jgi:hypothetical protein
MIADHNTDHGHADMIAIGRSKLVLDRDRPILIVIAARLIESSLAAIMKKQKDRNRRSIIRR